MSQQPSRYSFTLPRGLVDANGGLHRGGVMRLATAEDEVEALSDPWVQAREARLGLVLLSRVVESLGGYAPVGPEVIGGLYSEDFAYLQELYVRLNRVGRAAIVETYCPSCTHAFELDLSELGVG